MVQVLGIRHHGAGSAKSLINALEKMKPDAILIEGPPEGDDIIPLIKDDAKPPLALLIYDPKDFNRAAYFPYTLFSPEWQAIQYALRSQCHLSFMDLPQGIQFCLSAEDSLIPQDDTLPTIDPLSYAGRLAGYEDGESWWENCFEQHDSIEEVFPAILEIMDSLRSQRQHESRETLLREAYMRKKIRHTQKEGYQNIAVICGAWHAPALHYLERHKASADNKALRGLKKIKVTSTWIPWTYERVARASGYGAGVISPAWYELLFTARKEVVIRWMSLVASLLRKEGWSASSAHVIESVRLAESLATLRKKPTPSLVELKEAVLTIFCEGDESKFDIIEKELIIGNKIGQIPSSVPLVPLQKDLESYKSIKGKRGLLHEAYQNPTKLEIEVDLRKPNQLEASQLLYRLELLGIPWGKVLSINYAKRATSGNFRESWQLDWQPEFYLKIVEAGMWGNTVESAATNYLEYCLKEDVSLADLTRLIDLALKADLPTAILSLSQKLEELAIQTNDTIALIEALPRLIALLRYGSTRDIEVGTIQTVVHQIVPRVCIGLPAATSNIKEDWAKEILPKIEAANYYLNLLNEPQHLESWYKALEVVFYAWTANPLLRGVACRLLFDKKKCSETQVATALSAALSKGNDVFDAAFWVEGFLRGSGLVLIHNQALWNILDEWVQSVSQESFEQMLPLLRRTFSDFSKPERQKMMAMAAQESPSPQADKGFSINEENALLVASKILDML